MNIQIITALIAFCSALVLSSISYLFAKKKDRDAELRREKLEHYKDFTSALSQIIRGESNSEGQKAYSLACNKLNLIASQAVITALRAYQNEISAENKIRDKDKHNLLLTNLFYEIRKDLKVSPADNKGLLQIQLWASGIQN